MPNRSATASLLPPDLYAHTVHSPCATPCSSCGGGTMTTTTLATPALGSPVVETYTTPMYSSGPPVVSPGPEGYTPPPTN